ATERSAPPSVPAIQESTRRSRLGLVVPRVTAPTGCVSADIRPSWLTGVPGRTSALTTKPRPTQRVTRRRWPVPSAVASGGKMPEAHRVEPVGTRDTWDLCAMTEERIVTRVSTLRGTGTLSPRRIAVISVHTSPLHQPGTGDAGGMNVYIVEVARRLA